MGLTKLLSSTKAGLRNKSVLSSVIILSILTILLSVSFVLAGTFGPLTVQGDLPNDGITYRIEMYDSPQNNYCDFLPDNQGEQLLGFISALGDVNFVDNDDYILSTQSAPSTVYLYYCTGFSPSELILKFSRARTQENIIIDLGKVKGTTIHEDLSSLHTVVCDEFNGIVLSSEDTSASTVGPAGSSDYSQYYRIDQGSQGGDVTNDDIYLMFTSDPSPHTPLSSACQFDYSTIKGGKRTFVLGSAAVFDNYGVSVTFAPKDKAEGDHHEDFGRTTSLTNKDRLEVYANDGTNRGFSPVYGDCNDDGNDNYDLYYYEPNSGTFDMYLYPDDNNKPITKIININKAFTEQDAVVKIYGAVPSDIDKVWINDGALTYETVPDASGNYDLYVKDSFAGNLNFEVGGVVVFTKSITIPDTTTDNDCVNYNIQIDLAKYYGDTHSDLWSGYEISVYSDSGFAAELSDGVHLGDPEDANNPDYEVYFEVPTNPIQTYVKIADGSKDTLMYGKSATPSEEINLELDSKLYGTVHNDIIEVSTDIDQDTSAWDDYGDAKTTTFVAGATGKDYAVYMDKSLDVDNQFDVLFYTAGPALVLTRQKSFFSDTQVDVAKLSGDIDENFDTGTGATVWVYDSYLGTPLNSLYFVTDSTGFTDDTYYSFFECTSTETDGLVDAYFKDDSGLNEYTLRYNVDSDPSENDYSDNIVGGDDIPLDMDNTITGTLPVSVNEMFITEYSGGSKVTNVVKLKVTGTWPHAYRLYYDTTIATGNDFHLDVYDELYTIGVLDLVLSRNHASGTTGSLPATFDVAKVLGETHLSLEDSTEADNMEVYANADCTNQLSSQDRQPEDNGYVGGANDYAQYFETVTSSMEQYYVKSTMNDGYSYSTCGNPFATNAGGTFATHDIVVEKTGTVPITIKRVGIDLNQDTSDEAYTINFKLLAVGQEYHAFTVVDSDQTANVNYYTDTAGTNLVLTLLDDLSVAESTNTNDIGLKTGSVPGGASPELDSGTVYAHKSANSGCSLVEADEASANIVEGGAVDSYTIFMKANTPYYLTFCDSGSNVQYETFNTKTVAAGVQDTLNLAAVKGEMDSHFAAGASARIEVYDNFDYIKVGTTENSVNDGNGIASAENGGSDDYIVYFEQSGNNAVLDVLTDDPKDADSEADVALKIMDNDAYVSWEIGIESSPIMPGDVLVTDLTNDLSGHIHSSIDYIVVQTEDGTTQYAIGVPQTSGTREEYRIYTQNHADINYVAEKSAVEVLVKPQTSGSFGMGDDDTFNVGMLMGETHTNMETGGDDKIEVYDNYNAATGCSVLLSSKEVNPSDNSGGEDYRQYYEASQNFPTDETTKDYCIKAIMSGSEFVTHGNLFKTNAGLYSTKDLEVEKTGVVTSDIVRVGADLNQDLTDNAITYNFEDQAIGKEYHLFTVTDLDVDVHYYTSGGLVLTIYNEDWSTEGTYDNDVSTLIGDVPIALNSGYVELEKSGYTNGACGGAFYSKGSITYTAAKNHDDYTAYYEADTTTYDILFCDSSDTLVLKWSFTSDSNGGEVAEIDVAEISGLIEDNYNGGADSMQVYDDRSTLKLLSSTSFFTENGGGDDSYAVYFIESDDTTSPIIDVDNVDLKMTDSQALVSWRLNIENSPIVGGDTISLNLINRLTGDIHADIDEINLEDKPSLYDASTQTLAIGEVKNIGYTCDDMAMYFDTVTASGSWYLDGYDSTTLTITRYKGSDTSSIGATFDVGKLSGTVDEDFTTTSYSGQQVGASPSVDVYSDWNDDSPTEIPYNSHSFITEGTDSYSTYVETTTAIVTPDIRFTDEQSYISWNMDFAAVGSSIEYCDDETFNANILVSGDTPIETIDNERVTVEDSVSLFAAAIPQADGTYNMYADAYTFGTGTLQYRFYRNGMTTELLRRDSPDPLVDETFDVAKIQGDLEDSFRDAGYNGELIDIIDDLFTPTANYGDAESDDTFITNADSYEEWFEVGSGLASVDIKLQDKGSFVSYVNDFTDSSAMGVSGGDSDTDGNIEPGETMTLDLSYIVSGDIPSDIDYMYLYDGTTLMAVGEDNAQQYTVYVSQDWSAASTFDYAVDNYGVHDAVYTGGVELLKDSELGTFTVNADWDVAKISGGLDADFKTAGANEVFQIVDDYTTISAYYNKDGSGTDYWFINAATASDDDSVEKYEVYFEHQSGTIYDMVVTEDNSSVQHTYYMDYVDETDWGLIGSGNGDGISAGETQDWDLISEKSGTITEEAQSLALEFVEVTFYDADGLAGMGTDLQAYTETIADGTYTVYTIPKTYDIKFRKPGFVNQYDDELSLAGDVTPNDKELQYTVRVRVNDHSGQPLGLATVEIFNCSDETAPVNTVGTPAFVANPLTDKIMPKEYYYFPVIPDASVGVQIDKEGWLSIRDPDPTNPNAVKFDVTEDEQQVLGSPYEMVDSAPMCDMDLNITQGKDGDSILVTVDCNGDTSLAVTLDASTVDSIGSYPDTMAHAGNGVYEYTFTVNAATDDTFEIWAYANDGVSTTQVVEDFDVDNTAPVIASITSNDVDDTVIAGTTLVLTVAEQSSEDGLTGIITVTGTTSGVVVSAEGLIDNNDGTYYYEYVIPEGEVAEQYTVTAVLTDSLSNSDNDGLPIYVYSIIATAGPITENLEAVPEHTSSTDVVITATASNTESIVTAAEYKIGSAGTLVAMSASDSTFDSTSEGITATILVASLSDGTNRIYVHAKDETGNWGSFEYVDVVKDTAISDVTITNPTAGTSTGASFELNIETDETASCEYDIDSSGTYTAMTNTNSITHSTNVGPLSDGQHTIDVQCTDSLGNQYGTDSVAWTVTTSGPTSTITDILPDPTDSDVTMIGGFASSTNVIVAAEYKIGLTGTPVAILATDLSDGTYDHTQETFSKLISIASLSEGVNTVYLRAQDVNGDWGIWTEEEVTVDMENPIITVDTIAGPVSGTITITTSSVSTDVEDVVFEYSSTGCSGTWNTIGTDDTAPFNIDWDTTSVSDGNNYCIKATATDDVGKTGSDTEGIFEIDNGITGVPTLQEPADASYVDANPILKWNAVVDATDYWLQLDDDIDFSSTVVSQAVAGTSFDTSVLGLDENSEYYWHVAARDLDEDLGQYSSTWWFIIDKTAPDDFDINTFGDVNGQIEYTVTNLDAADIEKVVFEIMPTGQDRIVFGIDFESPYNALLDTTQYADGTVRVYVTAYDLAGNTKASTPSFDGIDIDNTAPTTTINTAIYGPYNSDPADIIDVDFADAGTGASSITAEYKVGADGIWTIVSNCNGVASSCTAEWEIDWTDLDEGENIIYLKTIDALGNSEEVIETLKVTKDTTDPEITFVNPIEDIVTADELTLLVYTNEDTECSYDISGGISGIFDNTDSTMHSQSLDNSDLNGVGSQTVTVECTDLAGNSDSKSLTWIVTDAEPYIASVALDPYYASSAPEITARAINPDSDEPLTGVEYFIVEVGDDMPTLLDYGTGTNLPATDGFDETQEQVEDILDIGGLDDSDYVVYIHAKVGTSAWGPFDGEMFVLDTTDPEIFDIMPEEDIKGTSDSTDVTITAETSEKADCEVVGEDDMDGDNTIYHELIINSLADSSYIYTIECEDRAGLTNTEIVSFEIDSVGPTITGLILPALYADSSFVVEWSATDAGGVGVDSYTVEYSLNSGAWTQWKVDTKDRESTFTADEGDIVQFRAKAKDKVGNEGSYLTSATTTIDSLPPEVTSSSPSGTVTNSAVTLQVITNENANCQYKDEEFTYGTGTAMSGAGTDTHTTILGTLEDGDYNYFVRCEDTTAGNKMTSSAIIDFDVNTNANYCVSPITLYPIWDSFGLPRFVLEKCPSLSADYSVMNVLDSIKGNFEELYYRNSVWLSCTYDPSDGNCYGTLTEFDDDANKQYWIKMSSQDRLEID